MPETDRIIGLMQWVVYVQLVIVILHAINIGVVAAILLSDYATWIEKLGSLVVSLALTGTSFFARAYQRRLGRALDDRLYT